MAKPLLSERCRITVVQGGFVLAKCWAATHVGCVRACNEDYLEVSSRPPEGKLDRWRGNVSNEGGWALVADGMGGMAAGEVASELAVELLRPAMHLLEGKADVTLALDATNAALFDAMVRNPALEGMGTTIAGIALRDTEALAFNVGDSRIYSFLGQELTKRSRDHVIGGNQLTQCLGASGQIILLPHVESFELEPNSKLLICSDGLTDMLGDDQIAKSLATTSADPAWKLVQEALKEGGVDNISVVVFELERSRH